MANEIENQNSKIKIRQVALAFLAHPDDAEILCAGTLVRLADAGWAIHIATCTAGDCGTMDKTRQEISAIRRAEGDVAAKLIGGTYHCLGEDDLCVCYDKPTIRKTLDLFRGIAPSLVFTHAAKDYMMDHEMCSLLARCASFGYGAPNASELPLIEGSGVPHLYYCDPVGGVDPLGQPVKPTTHVDITAVIDRKTEMLACHASQREWLRAHHGMDEYIDAMHRHGQSRGAEHGVDFAEAFVQHRGHPYPANDLLTDLLAG
ncbi:MAG: PIG-L family deacetylase [Phycisphaera sp.]|nr:PIG-L family deacetylase [Phycisphaera sp.]